MMRPMHAMRASDAGRRGERGIALLLALLTMVLLTIIVMEFTFTSQVGIRRAAAWSSGRRAAAVADAGILLARELLAWDARTSVTDSAQDPWARPMPPVDTGAGTLLLQIEDEQGKLNLNDLGAGSLSPAGRRCTALLSKLGMDPALTSAVADWVDRNQETGPGELAAEDAWYAGLPQPYRPRNAPLQSWAELALVRGMSPDVLSRLRPFATTLPEDNLRVNINTAPPEVLSAMDPRLDGAAVQRIVAARASSAFARPASARTAAGIEDIDEAAFDRLFAVSSGWFRVRATAEVAGALRSAEALVQRSSGQTKVVYLLPRRGPNIVGADSSAPGRLDDPGLLGGAPR